MRHIPAVRCSIVRRALPCRLCPRLEPNQRNVLAALICGRTLLSSPGFRGLIMQREGYIIVGRDHGLFPSAKSVEILERAQLILKSIESTYKIRSEQVKFKITTLSKSGRASATFLKSIFSGKENPQVRIILSDDPLHGASLLEYLGGNDLLVTVRDGAPYGATFKAGPTSGRSAHVEVASQAASRILEDIIVDISLGNFFRSIDPIKSLVAAEGLVGLYSRKARYVRSWVRESWLTEVKRDAGYATLSSLNKHPDDNVHARAVAAYEAWKSFSEAQSLGSFAQAAPVAVVERFDLRSVPKIGGQLPARRIASVVKRLPDGNYHLLVLRRSMTSRKSKKLRSVLSSLYGPRSRINSFVFTPEDAFRPDRDIIAELVRSGHLFRLSVWVESGILFAENTILGEAE